jgi:short subunit fatty acids transporter
MTTRFAAISKFHVISRSGQWAVTRQGASRASKIVESQEGAVIAAKRLASGKAEIIVHRRDGTVSKRIGISSANTR